MIGKASELLAKDDLEAAAAAVDQALAIAETKGTGDQALGLLKAAILISQGRGEEARPIAEAALAADPANADAAYVLSAIEAASGNREARKAALDGKAAPIWEVVETWLKDKKTIRPPYLNLPRLKGIDHDPGRGPT